MVRTEGRPVPRKAGGAGKKGKKFVEDKVGEAFLQRADP